jgi:predicted nuclease of predicted toxin-antitoxin system
VRFLLDANQSPSLGELLVQAGHDVVHVRNLGLERAADSVVLGRADEEGRVVVSGDTDFGGLLARSGATRPSVLLLRRQGQRRAVELAALIVANLDQVVEDLDAGAVVVLEADRIRIRRLPIVP